MWFISSVFLYEDLNWQNVRCFLTSIWIFWFFSDEKCDAFRKNYFIAALRTLVLLRLKWRFKADVTEKMATRSRQDLKNNMKWSGKTMSHYVLYFNHQWEFNDINESTYSSICFFKITNGLHTNWAWNLWLSRYRRFRRGLLPSQYRRQFDLIWILNFNVWTVV